MERKIGEIFELGGEWYQCVEGNCAYCSIQDEACEQRIINDFCRLNRIFKKREKVGEPIEFARGLYFQRYQLADSIAFYEGDTRLFFNAPTNTFVYIEIKTKEDMEDLDKIKVRDYTKVEELNVMEEKKVKLDKLVTDYTSNKITYNEFEKAVKELYADKGESKSSLKSFSLEAAKQGKPVCTRDGRKARIICFNRESIGFPIIALVKNGDTEGVYQFDDKGRSNIDDEERGYDLMMLSEKKEGWVNVYKRENEYICENECNVSTGIVVYKSEGEAKRNIDKSAIYVNTIKITWEE